MLLTLAIRFVDDGDIDIDIDIDICIDTIACLDKIDDLIVKQHCTVSTTVGASSAQQVGVRLRNLHAPFRAPLSLVDVDQKNTTNTSRNNSSINSIDSSNTSTNSP